MNQSIPDFPSGKSIERRVKAYSRNYAAHQRGEHKARPLKSLCKLCNEERRQRR